MNGLLEGASLRNAILKTLPKTSLTALGSRMSAVHLDLGEVISQQDSLVDRIYFVNKGLVSITKMMANGRIVEIGSVGPDGLTDSLALFGLETSPFESVVQIEGDGFVVSRSFLMMRMAHDPAVASLVRDYACFAYWQLGQVSACNRLHGIEQRCCRWILTAGDSVFGEPFYLTHEFLGTMLGVPRPSVSRVAKKLQENGSIDYDRGHMRIVNAEALMAAACECYAESLRKIGRST